MLRGSARARVDEKGRLKLPSSFRSVIEPKFGSEFFVTSLRGESVLVYPMEVWVRIEERLARASSFHASVIRFKNNVNYFGQTAVMDPQGRILLHPLVRERAAVDGDVTVLGQQDHLEVWNRTAFEDKLSVEPLTVDDLSVLSGFGI
jgi:MraZ protein